MTILYLQAAVLDDRLFMRDFFGAVAKQAGPVLVVHEAPKGALDGTPDVRRIAFTGKRLSANLSEAMVPSLAMSGAQRGLIRVTDNAVQVRRDLLENLFATVTTVVLSPLAEGGALGVAVDAEAVVRAVRAEWRGELRVCVFADNPMSPLGSPAKVLSTAAEAEALLAAYAEEASALARAARLAPVTLMGPRLV
jgi:hypothetical protein